MGNRLTNREIEVLKLIAQGHSDKQSAAMLGVGHKTINKHRQSIMDKTNVRGIVRLAHYALANKLVQNIYE